MRIEFIEDIGVTITHASLKEIAKSALIVIERDLAPIITVPK